jgi:sugar (pentulose or hexulose) kinase
MAILNTVVTGTTTRIFNATNDQAITTVMFCNNHDTVSTNLSVYAVANGGTVSTGTLILNAISLPATETFVMDAEKLILSNGDALWALSSAGGIVVATVSSVGI